jgi:hypothetical protein
MVAADDGLAICPIGDFCCTFQSAKRSKILEEIMVNDIFSFLRVVGI